MEASTLIKVSDKILIAFNRMPKGKGKKWLSEQLGISRPTLNQRFIDNSWSDAELSIIKRLGIL